MRTSCYLFALAFALITLSGCNLIGPREPEFKAQDGSAGTVTAELSDMGNATMELFGTTKGTTEDTVNIDVTVIPWKFDAACQGWIRSATGTFQGGSVSRYDTIWFYDAANAPVVIPTLASVDHYRHVRSVNGTYQNSFDYRYEMNVSIEKGATDTIFVFNGLTNGAFNGETFRSTTITNVKRRLQRFPFTHLSYPFEGTLFADRPLRTILVEFGGDNLAKATVTRKSDSKVWVIRINITTGREY